MPTSSSQAKPKTIPLKAGTQPRGRTPTRATSPAVSARNPVVGGGKKNPVDNPEPWLQAAAVPCPWCSVFAPRGHQTKCDRRPLNCELCGEEMVAAALHAHQAEQCSKRNVVCPGCKCIVFAEELLSHLRTLCRSRSFVCKECSAAFWIVEEYIEHATPRCSRSVVPCQLCQALVPAAELVNHYAECSRQAMRKMHHRRHQVGTSPMRRHHGDRQQHLPPSTSVGRPRAQGRQGRAITQTAKPTVAHRVGALGAKSQRPQEKQKEAPAHSASRNTSQNASLLAPWEGEETTPERSGQLSKILQDQVTRKERNRSPLRTVHREMVLEAHRHNTPSNTGSTDVSHAEEGLSELEKQRQHYVFRHPEDEGEAAGGSPNTPKELSGTTTELPNDVEEEDARARTPQRHGLSSPSCAVFYQTHSISSITAEGGLGAWDASEAAPSEQTPPQQHTVRETSKPRSASGDSVVKKLLEASPVGSSRKASPGAARKASNSASPPIRHTKFGAYQQRGDSSSARHRSPSPKATPPTAKTDATTAAEGGASPNPHPSGGGGASPSAARRSHSAPGSNLHRDSFRRSFSRNPSNKLERDTVVEPLTGRKLSELPVAEQKQMKQDLELAKRAAAARRTGSPGPTTRVFMTREDRIHQPPSNTMLSRKERACGARKDPPPAADSSPADSPPSKKVQHPQATCTVTSLQSGGEEQQQKDNNGKTEEATPNISPLVRSLSGELAVSVSGSHTE